MFLNICSLCKSSHTLRGELLNMLVISSYMLLCNAIGYTYLRNYDIVQYVSHSVYFYVYADIDNIVSTSDSHTTTEDLPRVGTTVSSLTTYDFRPTIAQTTLIPNVALTTDRTTTETTALTTVDQGYETDSTVTTTASTTGTPDAVTGSSLATVDTGMTTPKSSITTVQRDNNTSYIQETLSHCSYCGCYLKSALENQSEYARIQKIIQTMKEDMKINRATSKVYQRKLNSAVDNSPFAIGCGSISVGILFIVVSSLLLCDLLSFKQGRFKQ